MRKLLAVTAALVALVGTPAFAADMAAPVYKAPPPMAPVWSWTGFYIGLNGGGVWGKDSPKIPRQQIQERERFGLVAVLLALARSITAMVRLEPAVRLAFRPAITGR